MSMKNFNDTIRNRASTSKILPLKVFLIVHIGSGISGEVTLTYFLPCIYRAHISFCKYEYTSPQQSITVLTSSRNIYKKFGAMHRSIVARSRFRISSL